MLLMYHGFPGSSAVKNLLAMQETWVRSLGWEDPLGKKMATHSSVLAWRIPGMGEPGGLLAMEGDGITGAQGMSKQKQLKPC